MGVRDITMTHSQKYVQRFKGYLQQKAIFSIKWINNKLIYNKSSFLFEEKLMFHFEDVLKITLR